MVVMDFQDHKPGKEATRTRHGSAHASNSSTLETEAQGWQV